MSIVNVDSNIRYVTYREIDEKFDKELIDIDLKSKYMNKPNRGFWGSPVDAEFGWKEWCENEDYGCYDFDNPIYWRLKEGKIFQVDWDDLESEEFNQYVTRTSYRTPLLDFESMREDGIIAVQLMNACIGHSFTDFGDIELMFNSWDCESIVVLDKDYILFE